MRDDDDETQTPPHWSETAISSDPTDVGLFDAGGRPIGPKTEAHVVAIELPAGSTVVGKAWVWVDPDGNLRAQTRCGSDRPEDLRAFAIVLTKALADFKEKHHVADGDYVGGSRIVRSN